jgi:hypothetical protein
MIILFAEDVVLVSTRAKRIENAKQFLKDNLIEIIACAARIYDLIEITCITRSVVRKIKMLAKRDTKVINMSVDQEFLTN